MDNPVTLARAALSSGGIWKQLTQGMPPPSTAGRHLAHFHLYSETTQKSGNCISTALSLS